MWYRLALLLLHLIAIDRDPSLVEHLLQPIDFIECRSILKSFLYALDLFFGKFHAVIFLAQDSAIRGASRHCSRPLAYNLYHLTVSACAFLSLERDLPIALILLAHQRYQKAPWPACAPHL